MSHFSHTKGKHLIHEEGRHWLLCQALLRACGMDPAYSRRGSHTHNTMFVTDVVSPSQAPKKKNQNKKNNPKFLLKFTPPPFFFLLCDQVCIDLLENKSSF